MIHLLAFVMLAAVGAGWLWSARTTSARVHRLVGLAHVGIAIIIAVLRSDIPPAGWASALVLASAIPALLVAIWPDHPAALRAGAPLGVLTIAAALWAAAAPGPGVVMWTAWSGAHIGLSIAGFGAGLAAALVALQRLRGSQRGLLVAAAIIIALPLLAPRAGQVQVYQNGEALTLDVPINEPLGDQGLIRSVPARAPLPFEMPLRWAALAALLLGLFLAVARVEAGRLTWAILGVGAVHMLWLLSAMLPRELGIDASVLEATTRFTLAPELDGTWSMGALSIGDGPLTGGPGSPALMLPLAVLAWMLAAAALLPAPEVDTPTWRGLARAESWLVTLAAVLLGLGAVFGMVWSNYRWGGPIIPDPKVVAVLITMGTYGLYFLARNSFPERSRAASWLVWLAFAILLLSLLGPELGLTAPTLHHFGA